MAFFCFNDTLTEVSTSLIEMYSVVLPNNTKSLSSTGTTFVNELKFNTFIGIKVSSFKEKIKGKDAYVSYYKIKVNSHHWITLLR